MQKVFSHHDRFMVFQVNQMLLEHQIPCFIKNEFAIGAMGELSPLDVQPEVWLADNDWHKKALSLITEFLAQPMEQTPWKCEHCQEVNEASFELCWQCGHEPVPETE